MSAISVSPGRMPGARVDDEQRDLGVGQRGARLVLDRDGQRILVVEVDAAGVDQREAAPVPVGRELLAVARDAGPLVHDRLADCVRRLTRRRLADVRIADDGDLHASISLASTASVTTCSTTSSSVSPVVSTGVGVLGRARASRARRSGRARRARAGRASTSSTGWPRSARAAARALLGSAVQEDLHRGVGRDDGARCRGPRRPSRPSATIACCLRTSAARTAGSAATLRRGLGGLGGADRVGDVAAVEQHALAELDRRPARRPRRARRAVVARRPAHAAIHRPGVQVREAEPLRDGARDSGLSGPGGTVDGDDHGERP